MENKQDIIKVSIFGEELGKLAYDMDRGRSIFQYAPNRDIGKDRVIPFVIRHTREPQSFKGFNGPTFKGLPPMFADSLPDDFGNLLFHDYLQQRGVDQLSLNPVQKLAYIGKRGMGAFEYEPYLSEEDHRSLDLDGITSILHKILESKKKGIQSRVDQAALFNIFRMGTSAGGARPKIIVAINGETGEMAPGDIAKGPQWEHYIAKLELEGASFPSSRVEYAYYLMAKDCGIEMSDSTMLEGKHFLTKRFDRQEGEKIHVLTASGLTGWDFKDPEQSSYENLFKLSRALGSPISDRYKLFDRMVFNVMAGNIDDHLKNHSFIYDRKTQRWFLSPAYDITYPLNPLGTYTNIRRALSINGKRTNITFSDLEGIALENGIKNVADRTDRIISTIGQFERFAKEARLSSDMIKRIGANFRTDLNTARKKGRRI